MKFSPFKPNQTFFSSISANEVLNLDEFKTMKCLLNCDHNLKTCFYYHNSKDRRRKGNFYNSEPCAFAGQCPLKDLCNFSHNLIEELYHKEKYKTKFCSMYPFNIDKCEYGSFCSFAHSEKEINIDLIHNYEMDEDFFMFHFKTIWCPFNFITHDKGACVYAHNWQDFRRKPNLFDYQNIQCPQWKYDKIIISYGNGCSNGLLCNFSHGWKEIEFHPLNYKTKICKVINCKNQSNCPFFHNFNDKRIININVQNSHFKVFPRNRIVENTFKLKNNSQNDIYFLNFNEVEDSDELEESNSNTFSNKMENNNCKEKLISSIIGRINIKGNNEINQY